MNAGRGDVSSSQDAFFEQFIMPGMGGHMEGGGEDA